MKNSFKKYDIEILDLKDSALQNEIKSETVKELHVNSSKDFFLNEKIKTSRKFFLELAELFITPN